MKFDRLRPIDYWFFVVGTAFVIVVSSMVSAGCNKESNSDDEHQTVDGSTDSEGDPQNTEMASTDGDSSSTDSGGWSDPDLVTFSDIPGHAESEHYRFRVRSLLKENGRWFPSFAHITRCKNPDDNELGDDKYFKHLQGWTHTYTNFVMVNPVEVELSRADGGDITTAVVHPEQLAESVRVVDGKALIVMNQPAQIVVDIDGQMDRQDTGRGYEGPPIHTVSVFANPPLADVPNLDDPGVLAVEPGELPPSDGSAYDTLYFKPGVHDILRGFPIWEGKKYYIPGDAIVYGALNSSHPDGSGRDIRIFGYGTLSGARIPHPANDDSPLPHAPHSVTKSPNNPILMLGAKNAKVEGVTIADAAHHTLQLWASYEENEPTIVRWVKIITWRVNGDGINPGGNMIVEDSFLRTQDDAFYSRGRGMKRCVIWMDANGAAFTLFGGRVERPIVIEDIDVVYARAFWHKWGGGRIFSLRAEGDVGDMGGGGITFRDIRVTDPYPTYQTFWLQSASDHENSFMDDKVGQGLEDVVFQNISVTAPSVHGYPEVLHGHADAPIRDITFDNVVIGGKKIDGLDNFAYTNEHVKNITFK